MTELIINEILNLELRLQTSKSTQRIINLIQKQRELIDKVDPDFHYIIFNQIIELNNND